MKARDELIRMAEATGWRVSITGSNHLRLKHPDATGPVFAASTSSDHRAVQNALATMRRALPPENKPPAERKRAPKRRPKLKPKPSLIESAIDLYAPPPPRPPRPAPVAGRTLQLGRDEEAGLRDAACAIPDRYVTRTGRRRSARASGSAPDGAAPAWVALPRGDHAREDALKFEPTGEGGINAMHMITNVIMRRPDTIVGFSARTVISPRFHWSNVRAEMTGPRQGQQRFLDRRPRAAMPVIQISSSFTAVCAIWLGAPKLIGQAFGKLSETRGRSTPGPDRTRSCAPATSMTPMSVSRGASIG